MLLVSVVATAQHIPVSGTTPASFIPPGYRLLHGGRVTGDLNGDGKADVVLALGPVAEDTARSAAAAPGAGAHS